MTTPRLHLMRGARVEDVPAYVMRPRTEQERQLHARRRSRAMRDRLARILEAGGARCRGGKAIGLTSTLHVEVGGEAFIVTVCTTVPEVRRRART